MSTPDVMVDFSSEGVVVIERGCDDGLFDDPSPELAALEERGMVDVTGENGCRLVIGPPDGEDTFQDSEYVTLIAACVLAVSDMYDIESFEVIEAIEREIWNGE